MPQDSTASGPFDVVAGLGRRHLLGRSAFHRFDFVHGPRQGRNLATSEIEAAREGALFNTCASRCLTPYSARSESTVPRHRGAAAEPAYRRPPVRLTTPRTNGERCVIPTSATDLRHEHPTGPLTPALSEVAGLSTSVPSLGRGSLDGDPEALALSHAVISRSRFPPPKRWETMFAKCRAPFGPGGYCDRQPSGRHPPTAAFSAASRICDVTSDTLCRTPHACGPRPKPRTAAATRQTRSHRRLVKDDGFARARVPSTDECLANPLSRLDETRHRACDFAVAGRLPALLRLPLDPEGKGG